MNSSAKRWIGFGAALLLLLAFGGCEEGRGLDPEERAEMQRIFEEARRLDDQGRFHEALVRYETVLGRHPEFMSTRLNAAMAAYDAGEYQKALDHFEVLHKYGPGDWFVLRKLIQCNERLGRTAAADACAKELEALRQQKGGSLVLKRYQGLTRDYIPIGSMHLIGYEFFEPQKNGRLWFFKLEDKDKNPVSAFLLQSTPFFETDGKRIFSLTESSFGWLRTWHIGAEGRDYRWTRDFVLECLHGKRTPVITRPLPPEYEALVPPELKNQTAADPATEVKPAPREERQAP